MSEMSSSEGSTRLLVVTSDPDLLEDLRYSASEGVEVVGACDAREAWKVMQEMVPSAAVVCIHAGSAGGFGLAKDMAADARLANVPIMMLLERDQDEWLAKAAGSASTLTLPAPSADVIAGALSLLD